MRMVMGVVVPALRMIMIVRVVMTAARVIMVVITLMPRVEHMNATPMALIVVGMVHMTVAVSARFRLESFVDLRHRAAESLDHGPQDMIGQQSQPPATHLERDMPVADMVGNAGELGGTARPHFHQGLGRRLDRQDATVFKQQSIPVAQKTAVRQIDADFFATEQFGAKTRPFTLLEAQLEDLVDRASTVGALGRHLEGHDRGSGNQTPYQNRK
jgi:hypothetical protein